MTPNVPHRSVTTQVLSAGFAEFNKEMEPALVHIVQNLVHGAIGPKVGLNDRIECPLGSRNDWSGRCEPYPSRSRRPSAGGLTVVALGTVSPTRRPPM